VLARHPVAGATGGNASIAAFVRGDPLRRGATEHPATAGVDQDEPLLQLGVEVSRASEAAAGQERGLQVVVGPLDDALVLRLAGLEHDHLRPEGAAEGLALAGQFGLAMTPAADRALAVPDQRARHRAEPGDDLPPAGEQIRRRPGRDQLPGQPSGVAGDHRQHRQLRRSTLLAEPDRQLDRREPQIALRDVSGLIARARGRIGRQVCRAQLSDPLLEHRDPTGPADPLGDHRRRHPRVELELLADLRLDRVHDRPGRLALVLRRGIRRDRRAHGVPRDAHLAGDRLDRQTLRPMQPADLGPILHG